MVVSLVDTMLSMVSTTQYSPISAWTQKQRMRITQLITLRLD